MTFSLSTSPAFSVSALKRLLSMGDFHRVYETPEVGGSVLVFAGHCGVCSADSNVERYIQGARVSLSEEQITAFRIIFLYIAAILLGKRIVRLERVAVDCAAFCIRNDLDLLELRMAVTAELKDNSDFRFIFAW